MKKTQAHYKWPGLHKNRELCTARMVAGSEKWDFEERWEKDVWQSVPKDVVWIENLRKWEV